MGEARFSSQEILDLVDMILVAVESAEEGELASPTWAADMREWCVFLLTRLEEGG